MEQKAGAASEDSATAVTEMLKRVRCSKNCEYAEKGVIMKRVVQDALNVHDRVLAADVGDALSYAGAEFGPRSPLISMSKLVKLSQAVQGAASARKTHPSSLLRQTIQVMLLRLQLSLTELQEGIARPRGRQLCGCEPGQQLGTQWVRDLRQRGAHGWIHLQRHRLVPQSGRRDERLQRRGRLRGGPQRPVGFGRFALARRCLRGRCPASPASPSQRPIGGERAARTSAAEWWATSSAASGGP